jgi:hypothetical protein
MRYRLIGSAFSFPAVTRDISFQRNKELCDGTAGR